MANRRSPQPTTAIDSSVIDFPDVDDSQSSYAPITLAIADVADEITPWGQDVKRRDDQLREFFIKENMLAGAVYSVCARNAAFQWELDGPQEYIDRIEYMFNSAITMGGIGWIPFMTSISLDYYTTDNGFFIEIIRKSPSDPVLGLAHLDSGRCVRTGDPKYPVMYEDRESKWHKLPWYQVIAQAELPSAIETMNGVGYSAVTRVLRSAQILRDLAQYKHEKVSGQFYRAIHIVGGVAKSELDDVMARGAEQAQNQGMTRYIMPAILASLDPEKTVSTATIELASLPDNFELDQELKWYIAALALGFGVDYQDFAPLPGGNLGTSAQSEVLHRKSKGKGPALWMEMLQNIFHWRGIMPKSVTFQFSEQDLETQAEAAKVHQTRAETRQIQIMNGEITAQEARNIAVAEGDINQDYLEGDQAPEIAPIIETQMFQPMGGEPQAEQKQRRWWRFGR